MTPCCLPAIRAIRCPLASGGESFHFSVRIPTTWPGWQPECYGWVRCVTPVLHEEGDQQQGHDVRDLDHWVDRRAGGVLVGVADGVAGDGRRVGLGALAA